MPSHFKQTLKNFFRIHLLTAIVLVLTAGLILGLNLRVTRELRPDFDDLVVNTRGWPMPTTLWFSRESTAEIIPIYTDMENFDDVAGESAYWIRQKYYQCWAINISVALSILLLVAFPIEIMLRKRDHQGARRNPKIE